MDDSPKLPGFIEDILVSRSLPVLGICYGHQLLAHFCGGKLTRSHKEEYGKTTVQLHQDYISDNFMDSSKSEISTWMSHADHVNEVADDFVILASSTSVPVVAMKSRDEKIFGVQFHPEVSHTEDGFKLLENFAFRVCKLSAGTWSMKEYSPESYCRNNRV